MGYITAAVRIALGLGVGIAGMYFYSRIQERQEAEARLDRLEKILMDLKESEDKDKRK